MDEGKIAVRYARAILEVAKSEGVAEAVGEDMLLLSGMSDSDDFIEFVRNPLIAPSVKAGLFEKTFSPYMRPLTIRFGRFVTERSRERYLTAIAHNYRSMMLREQGYTEVVLTTATELPDGLTVRFEKLISEMFDTRPLFSSVTDSGVIGGFTLKVGDRLLDASVRSSLKRAAAAIEGDDRQQISPAEKRQ